MAFDLDGIDQHMANLRSTLRFFSESLERTDHTSPDWLATDLINMRNQSSRLHDDMQRFRDQLQREGLAEKKTSKSRGRLSLESAKRPSPPSNPPPSSHTQNLHPPPQSPNQTQTQPTSPPREEYQVQRIDVTEEVNRRLHESRLRRLMDSTSTSQKRKFDAYEDFESGGDTEGGIDQDNMFFMGDTPKKKRIRASGSFESVASVTKRKEDGITVGFEDVAKDERGSAKRRKR